MPKKLKIGVLMGGPSAEHEVSLDSGKNVLENLDKNKYDPVPILISKNGQWRINGKISNYPDIFKKIDFAFLALHGEFGEDGRIQALLEIHRVPYNGSGLGASALAMDKKQSRDLFKIAGLNVPKTLHIRQSESYESLLKFFVSKVSKFPVVVKPCSRGSSVGVFVVESENGLSRAIKEAFKYDDDVLIEEYIKGTELTCGVLDNFQGQKHFALPVTQIMPVKHKFFNYKAKYTAGATKEITPAKIDEGVYKKAQEVSVKAHQILGCRGYSRVDIIVKNGGTVYVLEVNTLPGLTKGSLLPQQTVVAGLTFSQLLDKIIKVT